MLKIELKKIFNMASLAKPESNGNDNHTVENLNLVNVKKYLTVQVVVSFPFFGGPENHKLQIFEIKKCCF